MEIITKCNGQVDKHEIDASPYKLLVHPTEIKVEVPEAECTISSKETIECMNTMTQKEWEYISNTELFQHFFNMLFGNEVSIPKTIRELVDDYSLGVIHGCGLIILLVEAKFDGKKKIYIQTPEDHLHPKQHRNLMSLLLEIIKIKPI